MAWTAASFKARYQEFATASDAVVTSALAEAASYVDPTLFGADTDRGVGLKTAEILALSPFGQTAKLDSDDAETVYTEQFRNLCRMRAGGPWIAGQTANGVALGGWPCP